MAYTDDQYNQECEFSRLVLKNVIRYNTNPAMVANAKTILNDNRLFEKFVLKRLAKKYPKEEATNKAQMAFGKFISWISFK